MLGLMRSSWALPLDSYNYIGLGPHQLSLPKVLFLHHQNAYDGKHLGGLNLSVALSLVALSHSYERGSCHPVHSSLNSHQQSMVFLGMPCSSFKKIGLKTHDLTFSKPSSKQLSKLSELNQHNLSWLNSIERERSTKAHLQGSAPCSARTHRNTNPAHAVDYPQPRLEVWPE